MVTEAWNKSYPLSVHDLDGCLDDLLQLQVFNVIQMHTIPVKCSKSLNKTLRFHYYLIQVYNLISQYRHPLP